MSAKEGQIVERLQVLCCQRQCSQPRKPEERSIMPEVKTEACSPVSLSERTTVIDERKPGLHAKEHRTNKYFSADRRLTDKPELHSKNEFSQSPISCLLKYEF